MTNSTADALAFEYAPIGIVMTKNRVISTCNLTFAEMFGYEREELIDQLFDFLYPTKMEFDDIRDRGVEPLRSTGKYSDERIMAHKNGTLFWVRVRGHSFTRDDPLRHAVWSFADISDARPVTNLTPRERQIVTHLCQGKTSKQIARLLDISHRTVETYRAKLLKKHRASNAAELLLSLSEMPG